MIALMGLICGNAAFPRCRRTDPAHNGGPRRTAGRSRAMRIRKNHSLRSQLIHVRRFGLRVALQHASPVIQIINSDK